MSKEENKITGNGHVHEDEVSFSSDDDDLILGLANQPSKFTQVAQTYRKHTDSTNIPTSNNEDINNNNNHYVKSLYDKLTVAQGEASMLRDKIELFNKNKDKERLLQLKKENQIKEDTINEINKLKQIIQRLEDEKKFLQIENQTWSKFNKIKTIDNNNKNNNDSNTSSNNDNSSSTSFVAAASSLGADLKTIKSSPSLKKRKIGADLLNRHNFVQLNNSIRNVPSDESNQLYDTLLSHRLNQCGMTTLQILNNIKLGYVNSFNYKTFTIDQNQSIGESITTFLLTNKKNMKLDYFINIILENLANLIKEISLNENETSLSIPFLVCLMFQTIQFRPSAVHYTSLKELFIFLCDLIKKNQHILRKPLHDSSLHVDVQPRIFQYEMIDDLIICFAFDTLEMILKILQNHNNIDNFIDFLSVDILQNLEQLYKLCFSISYNPIINIIFNMVSILNTLTNILISVINIKEHSNNKNIPQADWWSNCLRRLYTLLNTNIRNFDPIEETDSNSFSKKRYFDIAGLIRNIGHNTWSKFIPKLIKRGKLQFLPRVIYKDDVLDPDHYESIIVDQLDFKPERWLHLLKNDILQILENLLYLYPSNEIIANGDMLSELTKFLSREQEELLVTYIGQDNPNVMLKIQNVEHTIRLIYQLMLYFGDNISDQNVKSIESELITSLWRILVSQVDDHVRSHDDMKDHRHLVDKLNELTLREDKLYYEDALENIPEYIMDGLSNNLESRSYKIMQIKYDKVYQEMARIILETKLNELLTMDEIDSLYSAMGI